MNELYKSETDDFKKTLKYVFQQAIICERKNRDVYIHFHKIFNHMPEISSFWIDLAKDEEHHAKVLEDIQSSLKNEQLIQSANEELLQCSNNILLYFSSFSINQIKTLDDAYEIAHDCECTEIENAFKILSTVFITENTRKNATIAELKYHIDKLMDFTKTYGDKKWRKEIIAQSPVTPMP